MCDVSASQVTALIVLYVIHMHTNLVQFGARNILLVKQEDGVCMTMHHCLCSTVRYTYINTCNYVLSHYYKGMLFT